MYRVSGLVATGGVYLYLLRREFEEHGCKIRALYDQGDDSPEGEITDGTLDQLAKYEWAKIAERSRRGGRGAYAARAHAQLYGFRFNASREARR